MSVVLQVGLASLSLTATWLSLRKSTVMRRYACFFGMAAQPFWICSSLAAHQYGVLLATAAYSAMWVHNFYSTWVRA